MPRPNKTSTRRARAKASPTGKRYTKAGNGWIDAALGRRKPDAAESRSALSGITRRRDRTAYAKCWAELVQRHGSDSERVRLVELGLSHPIDEVRDAAIELATNSKSEAVANALARLALNDFKRFGPAAAEAIGKLKGRNKNAALTRLRNALKTRVKRLVAARILILAGERDEATVGALIKACASKVGRPFDEIQEELAILGPLAFRFLKFVKREWQRRKRVNEPGSAPPYAALVESIGIQAFSEIVEWLKHDDCTGRVMEFSMRMLQLFRDDSLKALEQSQDEQSLCECVFDCMKSADEKLVLATVTFLQSLEFANLPCHMQTRLRRLAAEGESRRARAANAVVNCTQFDRRPRSFDQQMQDAKHDDFN